MAPREPGGISQPQESVDSESEEDSDTAVDHPSKLLDRLSHSDSNMEQEYHTEDSDASDSEQHEEQRPGVEMQDSEESESEISTSEPPLLPAELLKPPLPSPAYSLWNHVSIPWEKMTRKQKRAERLRSRRAAKREWDAMQQDLGSVQREAKESGALEAGRIAQLRRGIVKARDKIKSGRVEKKSKPEVSGREQLLQERKRLVERTRSGFKPTKKTKKKQPKR